MIIQCEQCDTRFRMADEKLKPGGTKVRCSKCKHIFTVMPPAPEPEQTGEALPVETPPAAPEPQPEPQPETQVEASEDSETVDFGSFNMEQVDNDSTSTTTEPAESEQSASELDFSGLGDEMSGAPGTTGELADDFSFASTAPPPEKNEGQLPDSSLEDSGDVASAPLEVDFGAAFEEGSDDDSPQEDSGEFSFDGQQDTDTGAPATQFEFDSEGAGPESEETSEFDFGSEEHEADAESSPDEFSFDDTEETDAVSLDGSSTFETAQEEEPELPAFGDDGPGEFSFDDTEETAAVSLDGSPSFESSQAEESEAPAFEDDGPGEFSFDDTDESGDDSASQWDDDSSSDSDSFDFDEPQFETETGPEGNDAKGDDGLQFGEINFAEDDGAESPSFETDGDFSGATLAREEEPAAPSSEQSLPSHQPEERPPRERSESKQLAAPPPSRKSPVSSTLRILGILLLLATLGLGGLLGYFFYTDGGFDINRIVQRFPILEDYVGQLPTSAPEQLIAINIAGSKYVNNDDVGQLLVIQGEAVNNFTQSRSAITVKGVLLNAQGQTLFQQTVFCGNRLEDKDLQTMTFATIEEAMNNQFGDSLSNMDVAAGNKIPFTIVFRNLPAGIANINVEVVDSKIGGS